MNRYQPSKPRAALVLAAVAMTAVTIGAMVVLPAKLDSDEVEPFALAAAQVATISPIEIAAAHTFLAVPDAAPEERSATVAQTSARTYCAASVKSRASVAQPIPNTFERTINAQVRAIAVNIPTRESP